MVRVLIAFLAFAFSITASSAAEIQSGSYKGLQIISIAGEINPGDEKTFEQIAIPLDRAFVFLDSPGGSTYTAIQIGRTISIKGFYTAVGNQATCASACGLIWLAGQQKFVSSSGRVGFHATFEMKGSQPETSSWGNALVGAYLRQIGLSDEAIIYMTSQAPTSMQWMTSQDAAKLGITVHVLQDKTAFGSNEQPGVSSQPEPSNETATTAPTGGRQSAPEWKELANVDLPGHDLANMPIKVGSAELCKASCGMLTECQAFTFNAQYNACFLKGGVGKALQYSGAISGYRQDRLAAPVAVGSAVGMLQNFRTSEGVEITGHTIGASKQQTAGECQDLCVASSSCRAFTFYSNGWCLFKDQTKPTRQSANAVSGIKMQ